jgi:transposase
LFFLPPYSPEQNPDEQVGGRQSKHCARPPICGGSCARLRCLQRLPRAVRMFLLTPHTPYIAL